MPGRGLLNTLPAPIQPVACETDHMEGIHHRNRVGELLGCCGFEPIHRDHVHLITPGLRPALEPGLEHLFGAVLDHVQQPCRSCLLADRCQINDDRDEPVALTCMTPDVPAPPSHAAMLHLDFTVDGDSTGRSCDVDLTAR